jgi:hypothetical protein
MADRDVAWRALEILFGTEVRGPGSQPYKMNIVRVCGLSDRLAGSSGSTYVLSLCTTSSAVALLGHFG